MNNKYFKPVDRKKLKITSPYGKRGNGFHRGIDLRCVNFFNWKNQNIIASEDSIVLRVHRDKNDNGIIVLKPLQSEYTELKYIHVNIEKAKVKVGDKIPGGTILGKAEIRGQSKALHLHWETWINDRTINPELYIDKYLS